MLTYIIRRVLYAIPILIGVSLLTFILFYASATPDTIARRNLSAKNPTRKQLDQWKQQHGYDKPLPQQFVSHMKGLLLLRFGNSDANGEDIWGRIRVSAFPSFLVAFLAFFLGLLVSIVLALAQAYFRGTYLDYYGTFLTVLLLSIVYVVYIIAFQFILAKILKYFPIAGYQSGRDALRFVLLPVMVQVVAGLGGGVRQFRTFLLEQMGQDYVRTARAKGVSESAILFKHVLKNAAIPILTVTVATIPLLFTGSILAESFFGIPGLGNYLFDAIGSQDFAVVRAMVYFGTLLVIFGYILTDISYALFDPRVRLE
jgi:peptide/nickel transport system permease protein